MKLCAYGASSNAIDEIYIKTGEMLGKAIAERGHEVIFGGGDGGMMGAVARGAHENGGRVTGIAPSFFKVDGVLYKHCDEFIYPETMRERKKLLEDMSDAFIVTPGGSGTFDELFEILTLKQLSRHEKAIVILNIAGYYDALVAMLENAIAGHFMTPANRELYFVTDSIDKALDYIENYKPEKVVLSDLKEIK